MVADAVHNDTPIQRGAASVPVIRWQTEYDIRKVTKLRLVQKSPHYFLNIELPGI